MFLSFLQLINFRNLNKQELIFNAGVVIFYGDNAQGKTNLLEAIYLLSTTRSFRTRSDHQLIKWGEENAKVKGKAELLEIELTIRKTGKTLLVNKQAKKATDLIGSLIVVVFSPSDIDIVAGSPDKRRRYLDQLGSNLSQKYLKELVSFNKIMRSRNQTLFLLKQGRKSDLWVWDEQLAKSAAFIWDFRADLSEKIQTSLKKVGHKLGLLNPKIEYRKPYGLGEKDKIEKEYLKSLEGVRAEDIQKTVTSLGPHRDDFNIIIEEEEDNKVISKDLGIYGSRGEQRAATIALKQVEIEIIQEEREVKPILLLDEVLSELDSRHRALLLKSLSLDQVFITTTDLESIEKTLGKRSQVFKVVRGLVRVESESQT